MVLILQRIQERYNGLNTMQTLGTLCLVFKSDPRRHHSPQQYNIPGLARVCQFGHHSSIECLTPKNFLSRDLLANCKDQQNRGSCNCPTIELFSVERKATARRHFDQLRTSLDGDMGAPHNMKTVQLKKQCGAVICQEKKSLKTEC